MFKLPISKFKNAAPKIVKKEQIVNGVSTNRLLNTIGSLINSSLDYATFAYDTSSGGSVCTVTHEFFSQRKTFSSSNTAEFCSTHAHAGPMTDIQYSPFHQDLLATCGFDSQIQLWNVETVDGGLPSMNRTTALQLNESRSDCVLWNPNVDNILASASLGSIYLWDVRNSTQLAVNRAHSEAVQGLTWKRDGSMLASIAKDKIFQVFDPRNPSQGIKIENSKTSNKDSRLVWLGSSDFVLSSVFTPSFQREIQVWDVRNLTDPVHCSMLDTGNNVLTPLYDQDSSVLFLAGKAETTIRYCEVFLNDATNFVCNSVQSVDDQVKGVCLVPKFGMDIMKCEIDRLLLLTRSSVYPLPYFVPRRSYYDFYGEIYPDTQCIFTPGVETSEWVTGANGPIVKVPLNPDAQKKTLARLGKQVESSLNVETPKTPVVEVKPVVEAKPVVVAPPPTPVTIKVADTKPVEVAETKIVVNNNVIETPKPATNGVTFRKDVQPTPVRDEPKVERVVSSMKPTRPKSSGPFYQSKFKYIDGKPAHKSEHITNLRNLSTMWTSECNGFQVNSKHAAFILSSPSGQIGIVELNKAGRLQDTGNFCLINKSKVADFEWDPFDEETIAVACDDGQIRVWRIPPDGLESSLEEPEITLKGHQEKLLCIKYHPYARNVLASASFDKSIKIWNIDDQSSPKTLTGNTDTIFSISWSKCGSRLACICKDGMIRLYEPLVSEQPYLEVKCGPEPGSKAARIEWVLDDTSILVSGFGKGNARKIYLFDANNLNLQHLEDINQSPSLLIPHFDQDINVLYLFAKGEETLYLYEVLPHEPYFQTLSPYKPDGLHFALGFLPKRFCDVRTAEIGKAYRLTKDNRIEKISFTVPRVKLGLFQDDLFPDTLDLEKPYLSAKQWFVNQKVNLRYLNLQPSDLQKLSDAPVEPPKPVKKVMPERNNAENFSQSESMVINAMLQRTTLFKNNDSESGSDSEWK